MPATTRTSARSSRALLAPFLLCGALLAGCGTVQADASGSAAGATPAPTASAPAAGAVDAATVVRQAAQASASAGSSRVALDTTVSVGGMAQKISGTGVLDYASNTGQLSVDLGNLGHLDQIITPDAVYLRMPETGDSWIKAPASAFGADVLGGVDPADTFAQLSELGDVVKEGTETVDGVEATRYSATIDLADALAKAGLSGEDMERIAGALADSGAATATITVWVDGQGRVVRTTQKLDLTVPGAGAVTSSGTIRFYDFGVAVNVTPPPASDVVEAPEGLLDGASESGAAA